MKLSDLKTGQEAWITGISGSGAIKKRINEMGFIAGRKVKAIKSAPLKDPVEYDIMGYKVTIRQKDAAMVSIEDRPEPVVKGKKPHKTEWIFEDSSDAGGNGVAASEDSKTINVALVGNPNCGKTTIFNFATHSKERVANYSGVTVAAKEAQFEIDGYKINVIDLPGTYSLASYSPEEMFVTDYLLYKKPDLVINVIDSGNLERNLFLTTQLIDAGIKTVAALNMYDELEAAEAKLDYEKLGKMLGIPFVPTVGTKGKGLNDLFRTVIEAHHGREETIRNVRIPYSKEIREAADEIIEQLRKNRNTLLKPNRFIALQLLEGDFSILTDFPENDKFRLSKLCLDKKEEIEKLLKHELNTEIVNHRYGFVEGALSETYKPQKRERESISQKIDKVLTHRALGLPVFFSIIWFIFYATFKLGEYPMGWIESLMGMLSTSVSAAIPAGVFNSVIVDGIIGGVGGVLVFLPNIMILFFLISVLEDSGYMARTAFLMDKVMHKAGLHGKSFIPLLMGFGCNIPAVMATRTIESKRDRLVTMFITPFMSCSARLPVYVLFISAFFPVYSSGIMFSMYAIGIIAALLTAIILNKTMFRKTESPFVMELPPYRVPTVKAVATHTWFKTTHFLKKMGTIILFASILVWALGYFPRDGEIISKYDAQIAQQEKLLAQTSNRAGIADIKSRIGELETLKQSELLEQSFISRIGQTIQPVFEPLGFDWKMSVSILTGVMAKEVVVSSMGILYHAGTDVDESSQTLVSKLQKDREANNVPLVVYFGFLVFTLMYFPCLGTLIAIKKETAKYKWMLFAAGYPLILAWLTTFAIYQIAMML